MATKIEQALWRALHPHRICEECGKLPLVTLRHRGTSMELPGHACARACTVASEVFTEAQSFADFTFYIVRKFRIRLGIGNPKETPILTVFARAQNTADAQVAKGESEFGVHLEFCLEILPRITVGANYSKLLLLAPPNSAQHRKRCAL
jgi:hypothetical protein